MKKKMKKKHDENRNTINEQVLSTLESNKCGNDIETKMKELKS